MREHLHVDEVLRAELEDEEEVVLVLLDVVELVWIESVLSGPSKRLDKKLLIGP